MKLMRIPTAEGRYIWCRVQATRISKQDAPLRLVGKIVDIDEEVRRRAELERRTQRDSLTDLLNKTAFRDKICAAMTSACPWAMLKNASPMALLAVAQADTGA